MAVSLLLTSREHQNNISRAAKIIAFTQSGSDLGAVIGSHGYFDQFKIVGEI